MKMEDVMNYLYNAFHNGMRVDNFSVEETSKGIFKVEIIIDNEGKGGKNVQG